MRKVRQIIQKTRQIILPESLTRNDTALLKGVAILAIVLHNFCHWIPGAVVENEYNFSVNGIYKLLDIIVAGSPHVVMNVFSFFGCYGVPVFLFISGYGMVCKYENASVATQTPVSVWSFTRYNVLKLWRLMIPGIIVLFVYETIFTTGWRHGVMNVIYMLTFVTNFLPQTDATFLPRQDLLLGPWWYFSLTMQMYMFYRIVCYRRGVMPVIIGAAACVAVQVLSVTIFNTPGQDVLYYLRYTFAGCLLPFMLGVYAARHGLRITPVVYMLALAVFIGGCFNVYLWILSSAVVPLILLPTTRIMPRVIRTPLEWLGKISATLFVVHPIVRCFLNPRVSDNLYITIFEYLAASIIAAWALNALLKRVPRPKSR